MSNEELIVRIDERQKAFMEKLEAIHAEVKKTNGRVTSLEGWRSEIRGSWRATIVLSSAIGAVIGFVTSMIF
jgi:hypothetical protein